MKPSDAELVGLIQLCEVSMDIADDLLVDLAKAELQRRQQPASVPAELVQQWWKEAVAQASGEYSVAHYIANRAAAYGQQQAQWVRVSERPPKDGKTVIFWIRPAEYASVGKLDVDSRCFHSVGGWVNQGDVSHWMPLPEPPTC